MHVYKCYNNAMATTAMQGAVSTGTVVKTMLQISTPTNRQLQVISWGFSFRADPGTASSVELIETDVAATTGTAHVASGVQPQNPGLPPSLMTLGAANTGYSFTVEGAIAATRLFDNKHMYANSAGGISNVNYEKQFLPKEVPTIGVSKFLRVRVSFNTSVNFICWICWDE